MMESEANALVWIAYCLGIVAGLFAGWGFTRKPIRDRKALLKTNAGFRGYEILIRRVPSGHKWYRRGSDEHEPTLDIFNRWWKQIMKEQG